MKKSSKRTLILNTWIGVIFLMANLSNLFAQYDFIWIRDGYESATSSQHVGIVLSNQTELGGFQFTLQYDPVIITLDTIALVNRVNDFSLHFYDQEPGNVIVLVYNTSGAAIALGTEEVLRVKLSISAPSPTSSIPLTLGNVVLSDVNGKTLPCASGDGYLFHEKTNAVRIQNGRSVLPVNLSSTEPMGGVQFHIAYNTGTLAFDSLVTCSRISNMTISQSESSTGNLVIIIYSTAGDSIPAGYGSILNLYFSETTSPVAVQSVSLSNCTFSDTNGNVIDAEYLDGAYFIPTEYVSISPEKDYLPTKISLDQNYPNPFNASTMISFNLSRQTLVDLSVYDIRGNFVKNILSERLTPGNHTVTWNAENLTSGVYFIKLNAEGIEKMRKCLLIK